MKYPMINKQPRREVNVPQLSGGLNFRDSLTGIRDNQMSDCVNMWYKDGMLRSRPGFLYNTNETCDMGLNSGYKITDKKVHYDIVEKDAVLISFKVEYTEVKSGVRICFFWQNAKTQIPVSEITLDESCDYFVVERNGILYCYLSNCSVHKLDYKKGETTWNIVSENDYYTPTVMVHCQRNGWNDFKGTQFESYNLLNDRFKMIYSVYNENDNNDTHPMNYNFGRKIAAKGIVKATITYFDENETLQTCTHEADASVLEDNIWTYESDINSDGLKMYVCRDFLGFSTGTVPGQMPAKRLTDEKDVKKFSALQDNLIIEANVFQEENEKEKTLSKVFNMTQSIWYGGAANGINGGSRLFLCGNTSDNEGALMIWSALNEPLYFPENNYVYIGNKSHPVTAFGKQGENLIIFKPEETYYSYYVQNTDITSDELISQSLVDYEANSVYFPIVMLHSTIGCDCPNTLQLCRNRLVWLNSDGKVYTLVSSNQYSEMTIYAISDMVEQNIKNLYSTELLKAATSHDFEGHYILMIDSDAYVMDYNSYGYTHIYSYSKTDDANSLIPWYHWRFPAGNEKFKFYGYRDYLFAFYIKDNGYLSFVVLHDGDSDRLFYDEKFTSSFRSKMFDFSSAEYLKNIDCVSIGFGNNGGETISVSFITDKGSESDTLTLNDSVLDERKAEFIRVKNLYPTMRAVRSFGVKIECEGPLILDGLSLKYRLLGEVK